LSLTKINNENSNFSRIEEEESRENSKNNSSESDSNMNGWSRKFKNQVFEKFKTMVKIINQKKKSDYNSIILAIQGNEDDKILHVLTDADFKIFIEIKIIYLKKMFSWMKWSNIKNLTC
jgi:hypothetical protein